MLPRKVNHDSPLQADDVVPYILHHFNSVEQGHGPVIAKELLQETRKNSSFKAYKCSNYTHS
jgi:hypothetical protein